MTTPVNVEVGASSVGWLAEGEEPLPTNPAAQFRDSLSVSVLWLLLLVAFAKHELIDTTSTTSDSGQMAKAKTESLIPVERIAAQIYLVRGHTVMLDFDLAELYGVATKALNQAVTRNRERFPDDFLFRLSADETEALNRSQIVTGSQKHRDPRYPPRAFTQEGVAMLSGVLRSKQAVQVNVSIMRAFVRLREAVATNAKLAEMVKRHDREIGVLFKHVERLLRSPESKKKLVGFIHPKSES